MRTIFLPYVILLFITGTFFNGCQSSSEKVEKAKENLEDAQVKLEQARQDSIADYDKEKNEWSEKIEANNKTIADYKIRIETEEREQRIKDRERLDELQQRNDELKKQMNGYNQETTSWADFKADFKKTMDQFDLDMTEFGNKISNAIKGK